MSFKKIVLALAILTISSTAIAAQPATDNLMPSTGKLFAATTGEVILTFLSKEAGYSSDLYLQGSTNAILNNQTALAGSQYSLGSFQAGTELVFSMLVNNTGFTYFTGNANVNPDNFIHAIYDITSSQTLNISFEDLFNGGDRDYNDLIFSLKNVIIEPSISAVPEPEIVSMLAVGLMLLGFSARRKT